ncbi:hypothetical protein Tco_1084600, partial [Tanacetum coccineum]
MNIMTEEVRMAQHKYETPMEGRILDLEETLNNFIKESRLRQKDSENLVWGIKKTCEQTFKTQASSIKEIEIHLGRIAKIIQDREIGSLPSSTETNPRGLANAITTRSGLNYKPSKNPLENITTSQEELTTKTTITNGEKESNNPRKSMESSDHSILFPRRLKRKKKKNNSKMLLNKIPFKEKDPGSFTIPCVIGKVGIDKALADLGASISLMPYSMYARLDLGELKTTRMCIKLANQSTQYPSGVAQNVIVKIDKIIFPMDFVVLDMKEDHKIPIILGRLFLATAHATIDVFNKKISFKVGNETITFDIEKSMKFSTPEDDECLSVELIDNVVSDLVKEILPLSTLDSFLFEPILNYQQKINSNLWEEEEDDLEDLDKSGLPSYPDIWEPIRPTLFSSNSIEAEKQPPKLKELPSHLEYAFLNNNEEFPATLAWKVADIKGISPSFCTHKILMEDNLKPVVQPERRLNLK